MLFVDGPKWSVLGDACVGKDDIELALLFLDLFDNSVDARLRAVTCLCTELSPSICDEPSTPGGYANGRSGPRLQPGESVSGSKAITLETGRAGRSCLEAGRLSEVLGRGAERADDQRAMKSRT